MWDMSTDYVESRYKCISTGNAIPPIQVVFHKAQQNFAHSIANFDALKKINHL